MKKPGFWIESGDGELMRPVALRKKEKVFSCGIVCKNCNSCKSLLIFFSFSFCTGIVQRSDSSKAFGEDEKSRHLISSIMFEHQGRNDI